MLPKYKKKEYVIKVKYQIIIRFSELQVKPDKEYSQEKTLKDNPKPLVKFFLCYFF